MAEENRSTHKVYEKDKIGEVQIADEVVAIIAVLAATEVEGVDSMAGNITNELVGKLGMESTPSTSVAARPAMIATTSSAICTSPILSFSYNLCVLRLSSAKIPYLLLCVIIKLLLIIIPNRAGYV